MAGPRKAAAPRLSTVIGRTTARPAPFARGCSPAQQTKPRWPKSKPCASSLHRKDLQFFGRNCHGDPIGLHLQHTGWGVGIALAFVTLPFVVRAVQPVLLEIDRKTEEAAASVGLNPK